MLAQLTCSAGLTNSSNLTCVAPPLVGYDFNGTFADTHESFAEWFSHNTIGTTQNTGFYVGQFGMQMTTLGPIPGQFAHGTGGFNLVVHTGSVSIQFYASALQFTGSTSPAIPNQWLVKVGAGSHTQILANQQVLSGQPNQSFNQTLTLGVGNYDNLFSILYDGLPNPSVININALAQFSVQINWIP